MDTGKQTKLTSREPLLLAGTAVFSKYEPLSVAYTLPDFPNPEVVKGRLVILEFETCWIVGTYVPNAGAKLKVKSSRSSFPTFRRQDCSVLLLLRLFRSAYSLPTSFPLIK